MHSNKLSLLSCFAAGCALAAGLRAQTAGPSSGNAVAPLVQDQTVVLSPFTVTTDQDRGYWVSNSTSGTMLNTPIKDLPMPIEVIDSRFITDTGATDLRQALSYTSSIQLVDWNTMGMATGSFSVSPGKLNNPEGATSTPGQTTVKFRGFETTSMLRDGFARVSGTDEVSIDRIELVGGPAALLYGVSNFGGVVNYFVKQPQSTPAAATTLTYGSYDMKRATVDVTGPIAKGLAYRLTAAFQDQGSWTDYAKERHFFVSPIFTYQPFQNTKITLDLEYGRQRRDGISWQDLRAAPGYINQSTNVNYGFLTVNGINPRTFRWSGPDTFNSNEANNIEFKIEQKLAPHLHLWAGFNQSVFNYSQLDNMASIQAASNFSTGYAVPASDVATIAFVPLTAAESGLSSGTQASTMTYQWQRINEDQTVDQARVNLAYQLKLFEQHKWLAIDNYFLGGFTYQRNVDDYHTWQTPGNTQNYKSPLDTSPIRFGTQSDGRPDQAMVEYDNHKTATPDRAGYAVYQGKFFDGRMTVIAGVRSDRSYTTNWVYSPEYQYGGGTNGSGPGVTVPSLVRSPDSSNRTTQWGVSFAVTPGFTVFGMNSQGMQPNYNGYFDPYGNPVKATLARDSEMGIKFDLGHQKVSGTISYFTINRTMTPIGAGNAEWWQPSLIGGKTHWNPSADVVFQIGGAGSAGTHNSAGGFNGWTPNSAAIFASAALASAWTAGVNSGAIYQATNSGGSTNWYVDASKSAGTAYMDAYFAACSQAAALDNGTGWYGWFWNVDSLTNNSGADEFGTASNSSGNGVTLGSDRSSGFDGSLQLRPTENLQVVLSWTYTKRVVVNGGTWIPYPSTPDHWPIWYVNWYNWLNGGHGQPTDTAQWMAPTTGQREDDTPRNQGAIWVEYDAPKTGSLKGFSFGGGVQYTGPRMWYTGAATGITDSNGNPLNLETTSMTVANAMVRYAFVLTGHPSSVQLNVNNLFNERRQTVPGGWMNPRTWALTFVMHL